MEQILDKFKGLFLELQSKEKEIADRLLRLGQRGEALDLQEIGIKERTDSLNEREAKVLVIENLVSLKEETDVALKILGKERGELEEEKSKFKSYKKEEAQKITDAQQLLNNREVALEKARKDLEEEKRTFKNRIIEEVSKNVR